MFAEMQNYSRHTGRDYRSRTASPVSRKIDRGSHSNDRCDISSVSGSVRKKMFRRMKSSKLEEKPLNKYRFFYSPRYCLRSRRTSSMRLSDAPRSFSSPKTTGHSCGDDILSNNIILASSFYLFPAVQEYARELLSLREREMR